MRGKKLKIYTKFLVGKSEGKGPLGVDRITLKFILEKQGGSVNWMRLAHDRSYWWVL
jgi:hypothetical protein